MTISFLLGAGCAAKEGNDTRTNPVTPAPTSPSGVETPTASSEAPGNTTAPTSASPTAQGNGGSGSPVDTGPTTEGTAGADGTGGTDGNETPAPISNGGTAGNAPSTTGGTGPTPSNGGTGGESPSMNDGDNFATDVEISVHEDISTVLVITWTQTTAVESTWIEFAYDDLVLTSRPQGGEAGEHRDVALGIPADTNVSVRVVSEDAGVQHKTQEYAAMTESLPEGLPTPEILAYDATLSTSERWVVGSVEDSDGALPSGYLFRTFWIYIMDRQGRIVWYYADPASNATSSFQRIAKDGEYLWIEKRPFGQAGSRGVLKLTLDREYFEEIPVDGLADCIDVTDDGALLYDADDELREMSRDGDVRTIWSCPDHFGQGFNCYTNTINWNATDNSILMSFPEPNTVIQVDRESGEVVGQYGEAEGSWDFAAPLEMPPAAWGFGFQHFPNISADGTLLVSSHMPGYEAFETTPTANQHAFLEFEIDRDNQQLVEVWRYTEGPEWARSRGMVIKLANGNYLANYGTGGVIREITPDKQSAFHVKFDIPDGDDADFFNKLVGNTFFIDDLYRLNGGGPQ